MKPNKLVLIASPFQLLCAIEFLLANDDLEDLWVYYQGDISARASKQLKGLAEIFGINNYFRANIVNSGSLEERIGSYIGVYNECKRHAFEYVLIGDVRQQWMQDIACALDCHNTIVVDDGAAILPVYDHLLSHNGCRLPVSLFQASNERKKLAQKIKANLGLVLKNKPIQLFSLYGFDNKQKYPRNDFSKIRAEFFKGEELKVSEEIHFLGSPYVEKGLLEEEVYFDFIECMIKNHEDSSSFVYFPHREENLKKKSACLKSMGVHLKETPFPYEIEALNGMKAGRFVYGMHSTCLFSLRLLYGNAIDLLCFKVPGKRLIEYENIRWMLDSYSLREHIEAVYQRLLTFDVELITSEVIKG